MLGPGYTCACPDGYDGNAFATEAAFVTHAEGKAQLRARFGDGDDAAFDAWLMANRSMAAGFATGPLSAVAAETTCRDVRPPELACVEEPCEVIELEAASVQALVLKQTSDMLQDKTQAEQSCEAKWDFVYSIINEQRVTEKFCGERFERCLRATDVTHDGVRDYQASVSSHWAPPTGTSPRRQAGEFSHPERPKPSGEAGGDQQAQGE